MTIPSNGLRARRRAFAGVDGPPAGAHAGLWLDRWLPYQHDQNRPNPQSNQPDARGIKAQHILALDGAAVPTGYAEAFARRKAGFAFPEGSDGLLRGAGSRPGAVALGAFAKVEGRLIVGLGAKGPLEAGLTLDRTWGVPILPGSALKGLAASAAHRLAEDARWRRAGWWPEKRPTSAEEEQSESYLWMFGSVARRGEVVFHDGWWDPQGATTLSIHLDVMTVHHPDYYQEPAATAPPPSDADSPNPVAFASVSGTYLVVVEGEEEWARAALELLQHGFLHLGLGAKTSSGYGRLRFVNLDFVPPEGGGPGEPPGDTEPSKPPPPPEPVGEDLAARAEAYLREIDTRKFDKGRASTRGPDMLAALGGRPDLQRHVVEAIVAKFGSTWVYAKADEGKDWAVRFRDVLGE